MWSICHFGSHSTLGRRLRFIPVTGILLLQKICSADSFIHSFRALRYYVCRWRQVCFVLCVLSEPLMLPSRAIGNFLFPTCEVWLWACRIRALMSERIKCSIPLVDNHINIHRATHAVCWQFWNFGQIHAYFFAYKTYNMLRMIVHI